jgi:4-hydroxythreonine-4-phosphate dehydrogenase
MKRNLPILGVTMGDPAGIGPEIILKSIDSPVAAKCNLIVIGDYGIMQAAHELTGLGHSRLNRITDVTQALFEPGTLNVLDLSCIDMNTFKPGIVSPESGNAAFVSVKNAVGLAVDKSIDAIVTAPLNKEAMHLAGHNYPGHTEILAKLTNTEDYAMLLYDTMLSVIHVSTHISLLSSIKSLKAERIEKVIMLADDAMARICGRKPKIAVAGINPHAGENGLFGDEEINIIGPAVVSARKKGINVTGPLPPDTVFLQALNRKYDIVVAMYHDQGHIPLKLIGFSSGVNVTVGLPVIRTSVDHGTAFEIAWQGKAVENSMIEAIRLAIKLSEGKHA